MGIIKDSFKIFIGTVLLIGGLIIFLVYSNGLMFLGLIIMACGGLVWTLILKEMTRG